MSTTNPLSAEFLYELYATALRQENLCGILASHMRSEYLPDRSFQRVQEAISSHYRTYKSPPSYAVLTQTFQEDFDAIELIDTFREYDEGQSLEVMTDMLESYIKGVRLQAVYAEVGKLYNENKQKKAEATLRGYAEWLSEFTLKSSSFIDVAQTFTERYERNRIREQEEERSSVPRVSRFYIPYLDALNNGRSLRGQLTCFLASTGVGKSHIAKWIGVRANIDDALHILHFQLEGSEDEAFSVYLIILFVTYSLVSLSILIKGTKNEEWGLPIWITVLFALIFIGAMSLVNDVDNVPGGLKGVLSTQHAQAVAFIAAWLVCVCAWIRNLIMAQEEERNGDASENEDLIGGWYRNNPEDNGKWLPILSFEKNSVVIYSDGDKFEKFKYHVSSNTAIILEDKDGELEYCQRYWRGKKPYLTFREDEFSKNGRKK